MLLRLVLRFRLQLKEGWVALSQVKARAAAAHRDSRNSLLLQLSAIQEAANRLGISLPACAIAAAIAAAVAKRQKNLKTPIHKLHALYLAHDIVQVSRTPDQGHGTPYSYAHLSFFAVCLPGLYYGYRGLGVSGLRFMVCWGRMRQCQTRQVRCFLHSSRGYRGSREKRSKLQIKMQKTRRRQVISPEP